MGIFSRKPDIEKLSKKADAEGLIKALSHNDGEVRNRAAIALGELKDEKAVPSLIKTFLNIYTANESAAKALLQIKNKEGIEAVIKALGSEEAFLREIAAKALGENKVEAAVPALTRILEGDETWRVRQVAAEALKKIGWQPETDVERAFLYVVQGDFSSCVPLGRSAVKPLIDALEEKYDIFREHGCLEYMIEHEMESVPFALRGRPPIVDLLGTQTQIMHCLEKIGGEEAVTAIDKEKQRILALIEKEMSGIEIRGFKYGDYWLMLGGLVTIANFPIESSQVVDYINKILTAECGRCGRKIPKETLSALSVISDFAMATVFTSGPRGFLSTGTCPCGYPFMRIRLDISRRLRP